MRKEKQGGIEVGKEEEGEALHFVEDSTVGIDLLYVTIRHKSIKSRQQMFLFHLSVQAISYLKAKMNA